MEKYWKLLLAKLKLFGKKEKINTGDTGLDQLSKIDILDKIQNTIFNQEGFQIADYEKTADFYWSNGSLYISNRKGKFILYSTEKNNKAIA